VVFLENRRKAADLLKDFFNGKITNDDYDNEYPDAHGDLGISVVYDRIWLYYSDLHTHFLDKTSLNNDDLALFKRCVTFLQTGLEYEGPPVRTRQRLAKVLAGLFRKARKQQYQARDP
jgi:hypothetical protein